MRKYIIDELDNELEGEYGVFEDGNDYCYYYGTEQDCRFWIDNQID